MSNLKKSMSLAMGATFAAAMTASPIVNAEANPFGMQNLESGYLQVAEGKCGEGKCGDKKGKKAEGKCGDKKGAKEGKCGEKKGAKEGKCGEKHSKDNEGKCGEKKVKKEGKCGEGKCGGKK